MNAHWMKALTVLVLIGVLVFQPSATVFGQAAEPEIVIATTAEGKHQNPIQIAFDGTASSSISYYLYLSQKGDADLSGLQLSVGNLTRTDEKAKGELIQGYSLAFKVNGQDIPAEGLTLPVNKVVEVRLDLTNFTAEGTFGGELVVKSGANLLGSTKLNISRLPKPQLGVVGFSDNGTALTQTKKAADYSIQVYSKNKTAVDDLQIRLEPFILEGSPSVSPEFQVLDAAGKPAEPDKEGAYSLPGDGKLEIAYTLDLPQEGEYKGRLNLNYAGQNLYYEIKVTRKALPVSVEFLNASRPFTGTVSWFSSPFSMQLSLRENGGKDMEIYQPALYDFHRKQDEKTSVAPNVSLTTLVDKGSVLTPMADGDTLTFTARQTRRVKLEFPGLKQAGEYNGRLDLTNEDGAPVSANIQILLREPGWLAFLCLSLSIAASLLIRTLPRKSKKLVFLADIMELQDYLEKYGKDIKSSSLMKMEIVVIERLRVRLGRLEKLAKAEGELTQVMQDEKKDIADTCDLFPLIVDLRNAVNILPFDLQSELNLQLDKWVDALSVQATAGSARDELKKMRTEAVLVRLSGFISGFVKEDEGAWFTKSPESDAKKEWEKAGNELGNSVPKSLLSAQKLKDKVVEFWDAFAKYLRDTAKLALLENTDRFEKPAYAGIKAILDGIVAMSLPAPINEAVSCHQLFVKARISYLALVKNNDKPLKADGLADVEVPQLPEGGATTIDYKKESARLRNRAVWLERLLWLVAFLIAVISGWYVLYINDATWGGWGDYFVALIWGLGLFELGNSALSASLKKFTGLDAVINELGK